MTTISVTVVPQCDELGYESESYKTVTIIMQDGTVYDFTNVVLIDRRDESGALTGIDVYQNPGDDGTHPDECEYKGTVRLWDIRDEDTYNLALASWLLTTGEGAELECDVC